MSATTDPVILRCGGCGWTFTDFEAHLSKCPVVQFSLFAVLWTYGLLRPSAS